MKSSQQEQKYKETEIGFLPEEWDVVKLGDIAEIRGGYGFPPKYQGDSSGEIPFFKVSDMNAFGNEISMWRANNYVSKNLVGVLKAKLFPEGTIIFPKIGEAIHTNKKRILKQPL